MAKSGFVYLMANQVNGTTYLGVTSNLMQRIWQHLNRLIAGFSSKYGCTLLVWFEAHDDLQDARKREWQMKKWDRAWKLRLIERDNPHWLDLYPTLF